MPDANDDMRGDTAKPQKLFSASNPQSPFTIVLVAVNLVDLNSNLNQNGASFPSWIQLRAQRHQLFVQPKIHSGSMTLICRPPERFLESKLREV